MALGGYSTVAGGASNVVIKCTPSGGTSCANSKFIQLNLPAGFQTRSSGVLFLEVGSQILCWGSGADTELGGNSGVQGDGFLFDPLTEKVIYVAKSPDPTVASARQGAKGFYIDGLAIVYGSKVTLMASQVHTGFAFNVAAKDYSALKGTLLANDSAQRVFYGGTEVVGPDGTTDHFVLVTEDNSWINGSGVTVPAYKTRLLKWNDNP